MPLGQVAQAAHANAYATAYAAAHRAATRYAQRHAATQAVTAKGRLLAHARQAAKTAATRIATAKALAIATGYAHHRANAAAKTAATRQATKQAELAAKHTATQIARAKALRWATALVTDRVEDRAITRVLSQITVNVRGLEAIGNRTRLQTTTNASGGMLTIAEREQAALAYAQYTPHALTEQVAKLVHQAQRFLKTADVDQRYAQAFASEPGAPASEAQFAVTEITLVTHVRKLLATEQQAAKTVQALNATYQRDVTLSRTDKAKAMEVTHVLAARALTIATTHPSQAQSQEATLSQDRTWITRLGNVIMVAKLELWSLTSQLDHAWHTADAAYLKAAKNQQLVTHDHNLAELTAECAHVETDGGNQHAAGAVVLALTHQDAIAACADNLPLVSLAGARSPDQAWYWVIGAQQEFHATKVIVMGGVAGGNSYTYVSPFARYLAENAGSSYLPTEAIGVMAGNDVYDSALAARAYADSGSIDFAVHAMSFDAFGNLSQRLMIPPTYALADGPYPYVREGPVSDSGGEAYALKWGTISHQNPQIFGFHPDHGPIGTVVTLTGMRFGSTSGTVRFTEGTTVAIAPVRSWSPTEAIVTVPTAMTPGTAAVTVQRGQGRPSSPRPFTVTAPSGTASGAFGSSGSNGSSGLSGDQPPTPTSSTSPVCLDHDPGYLTGTNGQPVFDPRLCPLVVAYPGTGSEGNTAALAGEYVAQHTHSAVAGFVNGTPVTVAQMGTAPNGSETAHPPTHHHGGWVSRFLHWLTGWF